MSDQSLTLGYLQQFFRSFARPDLDRIIDERLTEARERSQRMYVCLASSSAEFLEGIYGFLRDDVRRLEQALDRAQGAIERNEARSVPLMIANARYTYERASGARGRIERYLGDIDGEIDRLQDAAAKKALREQALDLRGRVAELAAPLEIVGRRLDRYSARS